ncbi:hypothetical protein FMN50_10875 [Rhodobacterales bacterium]|nr:hypothetical protein FMN50_10875 [Rhodobacterales bacterium]
MVLPEPVIARPRHFTFLALSILVLGIALAVERVSYWSDYWITGRSAVGDRRPVEVTVGRTPINLPLNYIGSAIQRDSARGPSSQFQTLRLVMTWPKLSAAPELYGEAMRLGPRQNALLVELDSNPGRESIRARLEPFYRRLARSGEQAGPDGLRILRLSALGAAESDMIVFDPARATGFIARCLQKPGASGAVCHRALTLGSGLELRYSFDQNLLPQWRAVETGILQKIATFRLG